MADRNPNFAGNQQAMGAVESEEQFMMLDGNPDDQNQHQSLLDDFVSDMLRDPDEDPAGEYGTGAHLGENFDGGGSGDFTDFAQQSRAFGNPVRIPTWPVVPSPYSCTCCQTLRELIHANGAHVLKLDVHGRLGLISHAVLERYNNDVLSEDREYYMFDFCQESLSSVKQFLIQYCEDRKREGYVMLQDPLYNFYNAMRTGIIEGGGSPKPDTFPPKASGDKELQG